MLRRLLTFCFAFTALLSIPAHAQRLLEGGGANLDLKASFETEAGVPGTVVWARTVERPGSRFLRLHFSGIEDKSSEDFVVSVFDRNNAVVQTFTKAEFSAKSSFWSVPIPSSLARVEISGKRPVGLTFTIDKYVFQRTSGVPFSITIPDDREAIIKYKKDLPALYDKGRAVGKLTFIADDVPYSCTGFLISEDQFITNEHCVNSAAICETAASTFGYEDTDTGSTSPGRRYACEQLISSDADLDFALLKLSGKPGLMWGTLKLASREPSQSEPVIVVEHPAGEPKQVSRLDCSITTLLADGRKSQSDLGHKCDTLGGSSGSPVLSEDYEVLGLHHFGFSNEPRWTGENRAVRITLIKQKLGL
ncbi:serine protease [Bradyrhizobium sp. 41S5]|uniref:trypsin-like serine peptidase n=1 Tax=Bradyrhizobium sp. 41S5 TaxID=1404443 RepID=UPI00156BB044|nr:serine protease [Bradyrhizobium sp. 41S5]UFX46114.1 serine protease [Bradyrhizobium sp. 41S5]